MNNKRGFTLVELLSTIVILAIILVIVVPKVISIINDAKIGTLESTAKMVASEAEKRKVQNAVLGKEENITCENVSKLNDIDYKKCYIEFINNEAYITIIGDNTFSGMYVCKGTKNESSVVDRCPNERVSLELRFNGGSGNDIGGVYKEGTVLDIENPTKENATFIKWEIVKGNSTIEDNKLTVGSTDTIVHAVWENWSSLTIDLDGGESTKEQGGIYKSGSTIELEVPTRTGYTFTGWTVSGTGAVLSGTNLTIGAGDITLTANWQINTYPVMTYYWYLYLNQTWTHFDTRIDYVTYGSSFSPYNITAPTGYYAGNDYNYYDDTYSDTNYAVSGTVGSNSFVVDKNLYVNVHYYPNTYSISYNLKGGNSGSNAPTGGIYGSTVTVSNPTRTGYTFTGWTVSGTGAVLGGTNLTIGAGDITLTANWQINTYTIGYTLNGGTAGTYASTSGTYGSTVTVSNPSRTGYTFNGWSVSGTGASISGTTLTIGSADINLTANWQINTYTIGYTLNGGTAGTYAPTSGTYGSTVTVSNPSRTGYKFTGWSVSGTGASISGTKLTIGSANINLTANWQIANTIPVFTYTGDYEIVNDSDKAITSSTGNWKIRFLTSGTLKFTDLRGAANGIDVFLVGGGGGGANHSYSSSYDGRGGGGGGYTSTHKGISVKTGTSYAITIGDGGAGGDGGNSAGGKDGESSSFKISSSNILSAAGGGGGGNYVGGAGGSGGGGGEHKSGYNAGNGGYNGSDGGTTGYMITTGAKGQGKTTREFSESTGTLYAGGGGGSNSDGAVHGKGGEGGGGDGGPNCTDGDENTGGGGGGNYQGYSTDYSACAGGSGIVIIRNAR